MLNLNIGSRKTSLIGLILFYCLYFIVFLGIIQHPSVHYLSADLNYSNISDYAEVVHFGDAHSENAIHIHEGEQENGRFCHVCKYFQHTYQAEDCTILSTQFYYFTPEYLLYISSIKHQNYYILPALRAPPLG